MIEETPDTQTPTADRCSHIVGIGASAGGLHALEKLLDDLPANTGMTFVIIQHLSPDFESMMDRLLARHSEMSVTPIVDSSDVEPNHIYLLPPGKEAIISNGKLLLTERSERGSSVYSIDEFFRSLAQEAGKRAIGIILSGTGTDGAHGIRDIHAAGGLVIAQSLDSAAFVGMPRSAAETGVVDLQLHPKEIAKALVRVANEKEFRGTIKQGKEDPVLNDHLAPAMRRIFHLLHEDFNLDFSHYKGDPIARRIERRVKLSGCKATDEYLALLKESSEERNQLYEDLLVGSTSFFRDPQAFERLELDVIPDLVGNLHTGQEFRCWVAGTATGEEAYSIAMLLSEEFERRGEEPRVRIFASDAHERSLSVAGRGIFSAEQMESVTPARCEKYFIERQDGYHVAPELRKLVVFTPHNVIRDAPFTRLDLVSCRNLLTYLTPHTQQRVLSLFHFGLKSGGALCLGPSESLGSIRTEFQELDEDQRIFSKRREVMAPPAVVASDMIANKIRPGTVNVPGDLVRERVETRRLLKTYDLLLKNFLVPAILISEKREILHVFGGAGKYLEYVDGRPRNDLLNVIHPDLRGPLSLALIHLKRDEEPVRIEQIRCAMGDGPIKVSLTVNPFESDPENVNCVLVRFEQQDADDSLDDFVQPLTAAQASTVEHLQRELQFTQENLQSTIEQLQATNEELQSTNEQLTASNEELQSTNEELHSVNEELYTVNSEHQQKIDELTELNDDIDNLLTTTNVHTLFLDSRLRLRRFTPKIAELFNLIPQDLGRTINSFTHRLQDPNLTESIRDVVQTEQPIHREVKDENGQWYLLRIFPYLSRGTVEGAVLTLVDVTTLQAATEALQKSEERFDLAVRGSNAGIWDWKDVTQEAIWCSSRMYSLLGRSADYELTISYWQELIHPDDVGRVMSALNSHLKNDTPFDIECRMEFGYTEEYRWFHMRGAAERKSGGRAIRMAGSFEDVDDRRHAEQEVQRGVTRRDQFLAMLSHELRNPLGAITNAVAVVAAAADPSGNTRALGVVQRQLSQMTRLLDDLLDVSRITHGKIELRKKPVDMVQISRQAVTVIRQSLVEAELDLHLQIPDDPIIVVGDPARLEQVTVNLLNNAIKYTPQGGEIRLDLSTCGPSAVLEVRDTGVGIPADKLDEIFSLFFQSDDTLHRSNGGMGVGLTLVKAVLDMHDGQVAASSPGPGRGSCFRVELPMSEVIDESEPTKETEADSKIGTVVLVEDIEDAREMLSALLKLRGLTTHEAGNGREGVELIRKIRPDAAIIDIGLPEMDGHEVARIIREDTSCENVKLVALTGYGQDSDRAKVRASGFDLHLVKPLNPASIDTVLNGLAQGTLGIDDEIIA